MNLNRRGFIGSCAAGLGLALGLKGKKVPKAVMMGNRIGSRLPPMFTSQTAWYTLLDEEPSEINEEFLMKQSNKFKTYMTLTPKG